MDENLSYNEKSNLLSKVINNANARLLKMRQQIHKAYHVIIEYHLY